MFDVKPMKSRDIAIVGILLAVGAILRYFLAMLHTPMTPNMVIAFYCLAIILVRPKVYEALRIGIVAGILSMLITSPMGMSTPSADCHARTCSSRAAAPVIKRTWPACSNAR